MNSGDGGRLLAGAAQPPYVCRKTTEAGDVGLVDIARPGSPYRGQAGPVRHVKAGAQLMSQLVRGKILLAAQPCETVMRQAAAPHQFAHRAVVAAVLHRYRAVVDRRTQQRLRELIRQLVGRVRIKIPIHRMHHNIHRAAGNLIGRQRIGQLRIHHGKDRTVQRRAQAPLYAALHIRQHGRIAHLAARGRNRQNHADRQRLCQLRLPQPELPDIDIRIRRPVGNGLRRVNHAAAADRQNKIRFPGQRLLHALPGKFQMGIRVHAAQRIVLQAGLLKLAADLFQQPAANYAAAAVDNQHTIPAVFAHQRSRQRLRILTKHDLCRDMECKTVHIKTSSFGIYLSNGPVHLQISPVHYTPSFAFCHSVFP